MSEIQVTPPQKDEDPTITGSHEGDGNTPPPADEGYYQHQRYGSDAGQNQINFYPSFAPPERTPKQERERNQVDLTAQMFNEKLNPEQLRELAGKINPEISDKFLKDLQNLKDTRDFLNEFSEFVVRQPNSDRYHGPNALRNLIEDFGKEKGKKIVQADFLPYPFSRNSQPTISTEAPPQSSDNTGDNNRPFLREAGEDTFLTPPAKPDSTAAWGVAAQDH